MAQELKAIDDLYERRIRNGSDPYKIKLVDVRHPPVYLKSEVDAVLAEKDKEIERLDDLAHAHNIELLRKENLIAEKDAEIRRLQRALYKACANWAMAEVYSVLNDVPTSNRWVHTLNKCREKAEEYK